MPDRDSFWLCQNYHTCLQSSRDSLAPLLLKPGNTMTFNQVSSGKHDAVSTKAAILSHCNPFAAEEIRCTTSLHTFMFHKSLSHKFSQLMKLDSNYEEYIAERINGNVSLWVQDVHIWQQETCNQTRLLISKKSGISTDG